MSQFSEMQLVRPKRRREIVGVVGAFALLALAAPAFGPCASSQETPALLTNIPQDMRWQAVARGRVEPVSGTVEITAPMVERVSEVLVEPHDGVFKGELLVQLADDEARARLAAAQAQVDLSKRVRDDLGTPGGLAGQRRKAEDSLAEAERALANAQVQLDGAVAAWRNGGSQSEVETLGIALARAQARFLGQQSALQKLMAQRNMPLPTLAEGELNAARTSWSRARASVEQMKIRAPAAANVLKVNARAGELADPAQPLLLLGDLSALRVRAELDELDRGKVRIGQPVLVRAAAFPERDITGKVSVIAPLIERSRKGRPIREPENDHIVEVLVELDRPGWIPVGMNVEVYFRE
jgi:HlyD family secretion protein